MAVPVVALRPEEYRARRGLKPLPQIAKAASSSTASTATQYYDDDYSYYDQNIDALPRRRPRPRKHNELRPLQEDFQLPQHHKFDMERNSRKNRQMLARLQIADNMV
jgi:hypothetical protein